MARIMMIISPGKRSNYMKMVASFSSHLDTLLLTPDYPSVDHNLRAPASVTLQQKLLGDAGLHKALKEFEPDLIFTDAALYGLQAKMHLLRSGRRIPYLVHLLGDWWREYWSWFASTPWHKRPLGTQQFAYNWMGLALAQEILPVCKWLDHVTRCHLPGKITEVVYMAVDPGEFHELPGMHLEKPAVAIIQNHTVFPKVQGLLRLRRIVDKLPQVHFYVAEGQPIAQQYLTLVKSTYASSPNVHFVEGIHTPERVRMMLTAADCYVLASELDCCPTTVLEASLMCKPVVASKVGGVPETILENVTGWTIRNDAPDEWVEKIGQLIESPELRSKFGRAGRKWVAENFSWQKIAGQVENLVLSQIDS